MVCCLKKMDDIVEYLCNTHDLQFNVVIKQKQRNDFGSYKELTKANEIN